MIRWWEWACAAQCSNPGPNSLRPKYVNFWNSFTVLATIIILFVSVVVVVVQIFLVLNFSNQFDFFFTLSQIMVMNTVQTPKKFNHNISIFRLGFYNA